jgi:hypothetical protein
VGSLVVAEFPWQFVGELREVCWNYLGSSCRAVDELLHQRQHQSSYRPTLLVLRVLLNLDL